MEPGDHSRQPRRSGPYHVNGRCEHALAQLRQSCALTQRLQPLGACACRRYLYPRRNALAVQVWFDFQQLHELLQELLDGVDALRQRRSRTRFREALAVFL